MTKTHRKQLAKIARDLSIVLADTQEMFNAAQWKYDNASDKWRDSDKGGEAKEFISALESVIEGMENAWYNLNGIAVVE